MPGRECVPAILAQIKPDVAAIQGEGRSMVKTLAGGDDPYCSADELLAFYDTNHVGQLLRDDGIVASTADMANEASADGARLATILRSASGRLEAAALAGRRYSSEDLAALAGDDGNGAAYLAELVARLSLAMLRRRRGVPEDLTPAEKEAEDLIEQLRGGARILPFAESADAGLPDNSVYTEAEKRGQNLVSGNVRYFGHRQFDWRYRG